LVIRRTASHRVEGNHACAVAGLLEQQREQEHDGARGDAAGNGEHWNGRPSFSSGLVRLDVRARPLAACWFEVSHVRFLSQSRLIVGQGAPTDITRTAGFESATGGRRRPPFG
jgi:hypothetical protein